MNNTQKNKIEAKKTDVKEVVTIKKSYAELVSYLEKLNIPEKNMKTIYRMTMTKNANKTVIYSEKGEALAIFCWVHKQWEILADVEYGSKATTASGYNQMCKLGVRQWTALQKKKRDVVTDVLAEVEAGLIPIKQIKSTQAERIDILTASAYPDHPTGYKTEAEILKALKDAGHTVSSVKPEKTDG